MADNVTKPEDASDVLGGYGRSWWLGAFERRLATILEGDAAKPCVVFLCAESGMGKTHACLAMVSRAEKEKIPNKYLSFSGKDSSAAVDSLTRLARSLARVSKGAEASSARRKLVVIDDFPPTEECDLTRQARALKRMVASGWTVIVCMRPEAVQLAEEFPRSMAFHAGDMLVPLAREDERAAALTNAVPALVAAYEASVEVETGLGPIEALSSALEPLVMEHLRRSLPDEERRLRYCMMLLGRGTVDELAQVLSRVDDETFSWLHEDAPLLGVEPADRCFRCAALSEDPAFEGCVRAMRDTSLFMPEVTLRCCTLLASRRQYHRCVVVASLLGNEMQRRVVREWGIELICAGEVPFVRRVASASDWLKREDPEEAEVGLALALLEEPAGTLRANTGSLPLDEQKSGVRRRRRYLELLRAMRDLDVGMPPSRKARSRPDDDDIACAFVEHIEARSLLWEGKPSEAYRMLVNNPYRTSLDSLPAALLCDDYEVAEVLMGECPSDEERELFSRARSFLTGLGINRIACYREALEPMLAVLSARETHIAGVEALITQADRSGDAAIAAMALLTAAVADLRLKVYSRAHVRALLASSRLPGAQGVQLRSAAALIDALSHSMLDNDGPLMALANGQAKSRERDLAELFLGEGRLGRAPEPTTLSRADSSGDEAWELNMLCNDFGEASLAFRRSIPRAWYALSRRAVRKAQAFFRHTEKEVRSVDTKVGVGSHLSQVPSGGVQVEVTLLGKFEISVSGRPVNVRLLDRRRARALLIYLAMRPGMRATRYQVLDSIWSEYDYPEGRQRIYEATSAIRNAFGFDRKTLDIFVNTRSDEVIGLNREVFSVDVDHFERSAREALSFAGNPEEVIVRSCEALDLYGGDLCASSHDALGDIELRRRELSELFADVAIMGTRAALEEGRVFLAARLARRAYEVCSTREDVVITLIEAFKAVGRYREAHDIYAGYAALTLEQTGLPPSAQLRDAISEVYPAFRSQGARAEQGEAGQALREQEARRGRALAMA